MKTLISVNEIKSLAGAGKKVLYLEPGTIITPAARDAANEWGITLQWGAAPKKPEVCCEPVKEETAGACEPLPAVNQEMIAKIVMEVMAKLPQFCLPEIVKEVDPQSGFCLVKGNTVTCDTFETGNPQDKVGIKEILTRRESPNMATGFMTLEKSSFDWHLGYEEIDYVVEGTLEFIVNGKKFSGQAGDVFYIPAGTDVTFTTPDKCKFFFVTYPANWADLSGK
ncbi:cupin domain-containing protein [Candidatus Formimonas warabiya]|uniref:cupin domain-containing protein n=1 Tax=Formimonas warabiya TaxID=1761012 RepID=UPI0011D11692|nr:cupin domain-containing protein [Candidatus Formimonas warabiya]